MTADPPQSLADILHKEGDAFTTWATSPAGRQRLAQEYQRRNLDAWLRAVSPDLNWDWTYLQFLKNALVDVTEGRVNKLMVFMPPRHGKSTLSTILYPVYRLDKSKTERIIVGAYSQTLANKFSRAARKIARTRFTLSHERSAADDWERPEGGNFRAVGVGGGVTGQGADLLIIDDPIKSRAEANSLAYREAVWDWYRNDLYTRQEPGAAIILIMTRWHEDDLAGRILASEDAPNWKVISFPALAEENEPPYPEGLGRKRGEALCPDRFPVEVLEDRKRVLGNDFYALYQQRPTAIQGDFFKRPWFNKIVRAVPAQIKKLVRYWDLAATEDGGAFTAGVLMGALGGEFEGQYIVLDVVKGQWSTAQRNAMMRQTAELDDQAYKGTVRVWFEREPGSSGLDAARAIIMYMHGYPVRAELPTGSKVTRAGLFQAQAEVGNVLLLRGPWNPAYLDELAAFPNARLKDQVDASSGAFNIVNKNTGRTW